MSKNTQAAILLIGLMFSFSLITIIVVNASDTMSSNPTENNESSEISYEDYLVNDTLESDIEVEEIRESDKPISEMSLIEQAKYGLAVLSEDFVKGLDALANITQES